LTRVIVEKHTVFNRYKSGQECSADYWRSSPNALMRSAGNISLRLLSSKLCLSAVVPALCRSIYLLSRVRNGLHRRLSQCSPAAPDFRSRSFGGDGRGSFHRQRGCFPQRPRVCGLAGGGAKQHSSGDKLKLLGISKRGNRYLRKMFIQGARAVPTIYRVSTGLAVKNWWTWSGPKAVFFDRFSSSTNVSICCP
jgi:hypothetical protein